MSVKILMATIQTLGCLDYVEYIRGFGADRDFLNKMEATTGFEPVNRGFADPRLNHLATSPLIIINRTAA